MTVSQPERNVTDKSKLNSALYIYRGLATGLGEQKDPEARGAIINGFLLDLGQKAKSADYFRLKLVLPATLKMLLTAPERELIEGRLAQLRERRNQRLLNVYPCCSDEYVMGPVFLASCFGEQREALFNLETPIFTYGSCFASNIANHLFSTGYKARLFDLAEELNSPFSNAAMFEIALSQNAEEIIEWWLRRLFKLDHLDATGINGLVQSEVQWLGKVRSAISESKLLIVTLGNILDHHLDASFKAPFSLGVRVVPKFFRTIKHFHGPAQQADLNEAFSKSDSVFRAATFEETKSALAGMHALLRSMNPEASIVYTLSPVPIENVMGAVKGFRGVGAVEVDCISKSTLRAAIAELISGWDNTHYFPAYEIVRWLGPMLPQQLFGEEDANARHVGDKILDAVYAFFIQRHGNL